MDAQTRRVVDAQLGRVLGVAASQVRMPGVHYVANADDAKEVYAFDLADAAWVRAPAVVIDELRRRSGLAPSGVVDPEPWAALLGQQLLRTHGPTVHAYTVVEPAAATDTTTRARSTDVAALREAVPPSEWRESGFDGPVGEVFAVVDGHRPIAAANLTDWGGVSADVGVLVHPGARGRGLAAVVGAAATRFAVRAYGRARWRAFETNRASRAVARRLGYCEDGRSLTVTLAD